MGQELVGFSIRQSMTYCYLFWGAALHLQTETQLTFSFKLIPSDFVQGLLIKSSLPPLLQCDC